ncbi:MAG TPA: hypothetical protein VD837_07135 [Terriglobales bacterium]|nr:hypothetical protein [Terriglobales bacterium]
MDEFYYFIARILTFIFVIGIAGCAITIPIVAVRFVMVLFEKDTEESPEATGEAPPAERLS